MRSVKYLNQPKVKDKPRVKPDIRIKRQTLDALEMIFNHLPILHKVG